MFKKIFCSFFVFYLFTGLLEAESQNDPVVSQQYYGFNESDLTSCETKPHKKTKAETQGISHVENDNVWFMSSKHKLKVYDGFF